MDRVDKWGNEIRNLNSNYDSLASFLEVAEWVEKAENVLREADEIRHKKSQDSKIIIGKITQVENEHKNKTFLERTFGGHKEEKELIKENEELISEISHIDKIEILIKQKIDGVPKNKFEQIEVIKKLNLKKKELNIHKREVNENMRQVNASARQARAKWAGVRGKGIIGTTARFSRASITTAKEEALQPLEVERAEIESELASLEHEKLRISRIIGIEIVPPKFSKCHYCGRELGSELICLGCGAGK
jgi:hypothetical protein